MPRWDPPFVYGSREFSADDLALIIATARRFGRLGRAEVTATICENLPWKAPSGKLKTDSCRLLLGQLEAAGVVELPAARANVGGNRSRAERRGTAPPRVRVHKPLREIQPVRVEPVRREEAPSWNAMMAEYHPLGFLRAFGAQQKYWVRDRRGRILGGLLFAAGAKALAVRDGWIGWDGAQRRRYRHRIVANSRYLLLPEVRVPHLASHVLSLTLRRLPADWIQRYGYAPVLVETFVEQPWAGTCYRAANWRWLGQTSGRGRQDREHAKALPVKAVWVYPLFPNWRERLMAPLEVASDGEF